MKERLPEAADVEDADRLRKEPDLVPGQDLGKLLERAEPTR